MKSEKRIKEMFEEIHAPDELREKVISLGKKKKPSKWNKGMHRAAGMAVMLAAVFTLSNGICYAATGKTWVRQSVIRFTDENGEELDITVNMNGEEAGREAELVEEDGKVYLMIDGEQAADITEDFEDGKAVGTIHLNIGDKTPEEDTGGKTFYTITGDMDDYDIALEGDDEAASQVQSTEE